MAHLPGARARIGALGRHPRSGSAPTFQLGHLSGDGGLPIAVKRSQLLLESRDQIERLLIPIVVGGLGSQQVQQLARAPCACLHRCLSGDHALRAVGDALRRGPGGERASRELLSPGAASCQRLLRGLAAGTDRLQLPLEGGSAGAGRLDQRLRGLELTPPRAQIVSCQLPAGLQRLALEPLVQVGGLGLALERTQSRPRFALHVECPVEVLLGALELQLRSTAALSVLAEPRGLLDQQPAIAGLGGDERLDPTL